MSVKKAQRGCTLKIPLSWFVSAGASADMPGLLLAEPFQSENIRFLHLVLLFFPKLKNISQTLEMFFDFFLLYIFKFVFSLFVSVSKGNFFSHVSLDSTSYLTKSVGWRESTRGSLCWNPLQWFPKKRTVKQDWDIMDFPHVALLRQTFVTLRGKDFCIWFFRLTGQQPASTVSVPQWKACHRNMSLKSIRDGVVYRKLSWTWIHFSMQTWVCFHRVLRSEP